MAHIIACGDEGLQLNEGTRLGLVGSGVSFPHADTIISHLKTLFDDISLVSSEENDWIRSHFSLNTWEQAKSNALQMPVYM